MLSRWWQGAAGYQIYVPSFADGNGDGMGDFIGALDRLDYLAWLGIDLVWLTPCYVTPLADHGYDVADHCQVDPRFGDLEIFDALVDKVHRLGIRVLIDLVANHTSDRHAWFNQSRSSRSNPMRHWFISSRIAVPTLGVVATVLEQGGETRGRAARATGGQQEFG